MVIIRVSDEQLISALLTCPTIKLAAEKVGMTEQGVYSRLKKDTFRQKLQAERTAHFQVVSSKIENANFKALDTLINVIEDNNCPITTKVRASQILLDLSLKNREQIDILARIEQLEEMLKT